MNKHRLRDIGVLGIDSVLASLPDFELHSLRRVVRLQLLQQDACDLDSDDYTMTIQATYDGATRQGVVTLEFSGVRAVTLPRMTPLFYFGELEIAEVSRDQWEGVRYRAKDYSMEFEILCKAIAIRWG